MDELETYLAPALAILLLVGFAWRFVLARRSKPAAIHAPTLGVLNLAGRAGEALAIDDLMQLGPLFASVRRSDGEPPSCDVLLIYCDITASGQVKGTARSLRDIISDAGAAIVVVAKNHPAETYRAAAPNLSYGQANLVMALDRKGHALATFLAGLFSKMNRGVSMPVAWNQLAPQHPHADHGGAPETICLMERGQIRFKAARPK